MFSLEDKLAVVIGGTSTLGSAMAEGLAKHGANILLTGRNEERAKTIINEIAAYGVQVNFYKLNVENTDSIIQVADYVDNEFGGWDILINSTGVNSQTPFFEIESSEWDHIMNINLKSVVFTCQQFVNRNKHRNRPGSIINISSVSSTTPLSRVMTYSASKAGINSITQFMAREFAPFNIRVNAIIPGFFPAEQNKKILDEERVANIIQHTPMKRFGKPNELQGAVVFLASEEASSYVTGSFITVDGGFGATKM